MAKFFQKILCPIDFDENSMAALDYACRLAVENDAVLYVLHAIFIPVCGELLIFDTNQQLPHTRRAQGRVLSEPVSARPLRRADRHTHVCSKQQVNGPFCICVWNLNQALHLQRPDAPPRLDARPTQDFERPLNLGCDIRIATLGSYFDGRHSHK